MNHVLPNKRTDKKGGFLNRVQAFGGIFFAFTAFLIFFSSNPSRLAWLTLACIACLLLQRSQRSFTLGSSICYPVCLCALLSSHVLRTHHKTHAQASMQIYGIDVDGKIGIYQLIHFSNIKATVSSCFISPTTLVTTSQQKERPK